jgi:hypothetical protein
MFKRVSMAEDGAVARFGEKLPYDDAATDWEDNGSSDEEDVGKGY